MEPLDDFAVAVDQKLGEVPLDVAWLLGSCQVVLGEESGGIETLTHSLTHSSTVIFTTVRGSSKSLFHSSSSQGMGTPSRVKKSAPHLSIACMIGTVALPRQVKAYSVLGGTTG